MDDAGQAIFSSGQRDVHCDKGVGRFIRIVRFGITGVVSNALLLALFAAMIAIGIQIVVASVFVYVLGVASTYFVNRNWSFGSTRKHDKAGPAYIGTQLLGLVILLCLQGLLHMRLGLPAVIVQAVAIPGVAAISFILLEWVVFPRVTTHPKS